MDITPLFKACVKAARTRNKTLGPGEDRQRILRPGAGGARPRSSFGAVARDVTAQVTRLREFLLEHRAPYLAGLDAPGRRRGAGDWSEAERDALDAGAQRALNTCAALLRDLRDTNRHAQVPPQTRDYQTAVVDLTDSYLKAVCKIHSELKALRVKRALDVRKLSRLEMPQNKQMAVSASLPLHVVHDDEEPSQITENGTEAPGETAPPDGPTAAGRRATELTESEAAVLSDEERLTAEELQMFESENHQLFDELNDLSEEVKQIESKVLHIAELQEIFTEKILQQEQDIERVASVVVGATENVKDANEQIRRAIQRNAGLRVYVLFFLLVMSFSLLFLDWYND